MNALCLPACAADVTNAMSDSAAVAMKSLFGIPPANRIDTGCRGQSPKKGRGQLDAGSRLLELTLDRVGLLLRDAFLDRVGSAVDEVLRLLQAEPGDRADDLDHLDLLVAGALEDDVERRLLLGGRRPVARRRARRRDGHRSGRGHAPGLLERVL